MVYLGSDSFIHSEHFYRPSSSPYCCIDTVSGLTRRSAEGLAQDPYVAARAGSEPATFQTQGTEPANEPPCLMMMMMSSLPKGRSLAFMLAGDKIS